MNPAFRLIRANSRLIIYGIIGAFSSTLDFVIYTSLVMIGLNMLIANVIGVNIGIFTSFSLNRTYNFKVKDHSRRRFASFYAVGLIGLLLSTAILYLTVDILHLSEITAKIIAIIIVALFQFILNSKITFRKSNT